MCVEREGKKKKEETKTRFCVRKAKKTAGRVCVEREGKKKKKRQKKVLREEGEKDGLACVCVWCVCVCRENRKTVRGEERGERNVAHTNGTFLFGVSPTAAHCFNTWRPPHWAGGQVKTGAPQRTTTTLAEHDVATWHTTRPEQHERQQAEMYYIT